MKHFARVSNGKLLLTNKNAFLDDVRALEGETVTISLEKGKKRSKKQNRAYWGIIIPMLVEEIGGTKDEISYLLREQFLSNKFHIELQGKMKEVTVIKGTSELTTAEFEDYCSRIRNWASLPREQGGLELYIPEPNEENYYV